MSFASIPDILEDLRAGKPIVLVDDEDRENEGDIVYAAEHCTPEAINFMVTHARGVVCLALTEAWCDRLRLHAQAEKNTAQLSTAFLVTVDADPKFGVTTGVSARDRSITIQVAIAEDAQPQDLLRPGHVNPLRARDGGVLVRAGQTEGSVDLARLAGLKPAGVICEILRDDGEMMRRLELEGFCAKHGLKMCTVRDMIAYRLEREQFVRRIESITLPTAFGDFDLKAYQSVLDAEPHLALTLGIDGTTRQDEPVLVRVHRECLVGDVFGATKCDCSANLAASLRMIREAGKGVLVYLRQESRKSVTGSAAETCAAGNLREVGIGSQILRDLGLTKLAVLTNRPKKHYGVEGYGLEVVREVPIEIHPEDKTWRAGHRLPAIASAGK